MGLLSAIKNVPSAVMKAAGKVAFKISKNKPQIMVIGGVTVATTAFVLAIVNATKMKDQMLVIESKKDELQMKKDEAQNPQNNLTEEESKAIIVACDKDLRKTTVDAAWMIFKLIGVPAILFLGGVSLSVGGHWILVKRFGQLSTAFATLQETFNRYRQYNIKEHGEECDRRYRYGIVDSTTTTATVTDENGKTKNVKCTVPVADQNEAASMYTFIFSPEFSAKCPRDPINMISYLRCQEKYWNVWMEAHNKPVTLYMVLDDLGIEIDPDDPKNDYLLIAGWRPNGDGDNYIDFGIMRAVNKPALDMMSNTCFLNFNCDGNLYHSARYTKDGKKVC